jgi:hypothetical protein
MHFRFVVGQKEKTKRCLFAFHSVNTATAEGDALGVKFNGTQANALTANPFSTPLLMFPRLTITQVNISYGGYNVVYNM